jgi:hypothetical protein
VSVRRVKRWTSVHPPEIALAVHDVVGHLPPFVDWISMLVTMESVLVSPPLPIGGPPLSWRCAHPDCGIQYIAHSGYYGVNGHPWVSPTAPETPA